MSEEKKEVKEPTIKQEKAKKPEEKKYPEGIEAKIDGMTMKDLEVGFKMICLHSGQNQVITAMGFKPFTVQDAGNLVKKR